MKKNIEFEFNMKVFQQGHEVAALSKALGKWELGIQNDLHREFSIPLFSIPINSMKIQAKNDIVTLILEGPWSGLIQAGPYSLHKPYRPHEPTIIDLKPGDLGSFQFYGLSFAFKIRKRKKNTEKTVRLNPKLRARPLADLISVFSAPWVVAVSILLSTLLLGGSIAGLWLRKDLRPQAFSELNNAYTLNFISPMVLETLPEALNTSLSREPYTAQSIRHYQAVSDLLLGFPIKANDKTVRTLYPSSIEVAAQDKEQQLLKVEDFLSQASAKENLSALNPNNTQLMLYSALWGTADLELLAALKKVESYQSGLGLQYEARAAVLKDFRGDVNYDYAKYFVGKKEEATKAINAPGLEKIKLEGLYSDEERLYMETKNLAQQAKSLQQKLASAQFTGREKTPQIILVNQNLSQFAFAPQSRSLLSEDLLIGLQGIPYGSKPQITAKVEEVATGDIDPRAVEKIIEAGQFKLRLCFESALRRNQSTKGTMQWRWRIDIDGRPQGLQLISSSIQDDTMVRCIRDVMMTWIFPKPNKGSVLVNRAFEFQADAG